MTSRRTISAGMLANFMLKHAPEGVIEAVASCAATESPCWREFFKSGLADLIAADRRLERLFFRRIFEQSMHTHAAEIIEAYLVNMAPVARARFFSLDALRDKRHPMNEVFDRSAYSTANGQAFRVAVVPEPCGQGARRLQRGISQTAAAPVRRADSSTIWPLSSSPYVRSGCPLILFTDKSLGTPDAPACRRARRQTRAAVALIRAKFPSTSKGVLEFAEIMESLSS